MSKKAIGIFPDGKIKEYTIDEHFTAKEKNEVRDPSIKLICPYPGCGVEVIFCDAESKYFRAHKGLKHNPRCPYGIDSTIQVLATTDLTGKGFDEESFLENLGKRNSATGGSGATSGTGSGKTATPTTAVSPLGKGTITRVLKQVNTVKSLFIVLENSDINDLFGEKPVKDWILDERTYESYQAEPEASRLENFHLVLATTYKMAYDDSNCRLRMRIAAPKSAKMPQLYCILSFSDQNLYKETKKKLKNFDNLNDRRTVVIAGNWSHIQAGGSDYSKIPSNSYITEIASKKCIYVY